MILRKPYAILIKYFKVIHIVLFVLCCYLMFTLKSNYDFLKECVNYEGISYYDGIANEHLPAILFVVTIILLLAGIAILLLMKQKNKPVLYYRVLIIYSTVLFVCLIILRSFYSGLKSSTPDLLTISAYRDISMALYLVSFYFIGVTFIRGFGFDIKKFSFEQDLKELKGLEVTDADNEEFEVALEFDKEKWRSKIRKEKRLMSYYLKENAKILIMIGSAAIIIGGTLAYIDYKENVKIYKENEEVTFDGIVYKINNTYVTDTAKNGKKLKGQYVIVQFSCVAAGEDKKINVGSTKLTINGKEYRPNTQLGKDFNDIGTPYVKQYVGSTPQQFIFVFDVDKNLKGDFLLQVFKELGSGKDLVKYGKISLKPKYFFNEINEENAYGTEVDVSKSFLKRGTVNIKDHEIAQRYIVDYEECKDIIGSDEKDCKQFKKSIFSVTGNNILKIGYESKDLKVNNIRYYFNLEYLDNGKEISISNDELILAYKDNEYLYFEVPSYVDDSDEFNIILNIRDSFYKFKDKINKEEVKEVEG